MCACDVCHTTYNNRFQWFTRPAQNNYKSHMTDISLFMNLIIDFWFCYATLLTELDSVRSTNSSSNRHSLLPWGTQSRSCIAATSGIIDMQSSTDGSLRPGEIVMRTLFADFTQQAEKKIEGVMLEATVIHLQMILSILISIVELNAFSQFHRTKIWQSCCNVGKIHSSINCCRLLVVWPNIAFHR